MAGSFRGLAPSDRAPVSAHPVREAHRYTDLTSPTIDFVDRKHAIGSDVDLGDAIASRLGLTPVSVHGG